MSVTGSFYGRERFDPVLILAQIVLLQACFYTSYLLLLVFFNRATGTTASVTDQVFDHTQITLKHFPGWVTSSALILAAAGPTALAFVALVGRAKRATDFACTLLISHIIATTIHSGLPKSMIWWVLHIAATVGMAVVAEFVSLRLELRDIAVPRPSSGNHSNSGSTNPSSAGANNDRDGGRSSIADRGEPSRGNTHRDSSDRDTNQQHKREIDIEAQLDEVDRSHISQTDSKPLVAPT